MLLAAAIFLGQGVQVANGSYHADAFLYLVTACVFAVSALLLPKLGHSPRHASSTVTAIAACGFAWAMIKLASSSPSAGLQMTNPQAFGPFLQGLMIAAVVGGGCFREVAGKSRLLLWMVLGLFVALAAWVIHQSPEPWIDVYLFQRDGIRALLSGTNPYSITHPNIYGHGHYYAPQLLADNRVQLGSPYPPLVTLLGVPGQVLFGDYRYSHLALTALTGVLMAFTAPGMVGTAICTCFLFMPRNFFVLEQGWTEPYSAFFLALLVYQAVRQKRVSFWTLGLLLATKQYVVVLLPIVGLLMPTLASRRARLVLLVRACGVAAAVTLPFFLWQPSAFLHDVVGTQIMQPFRPDSMGFLAWYAQHHALAFTTLPMVIATLLAWLCGFWRAPRNPAGFAAAAALTMLAFFAFSKQPFCNYYFFTIALLCTAAAAAAAQFPAEPPTEMKRTH